MFFSSSLLCAVSLLAVGATDVIALRVPDKDPFYSPPAGFEKLPHGSVLKNRTSLFQEPRFPYDKGHNATQILFSTQFKNGTAVATVATIIVPAKNLTEGQTINKLVSYQHFEDRINNTCSPSYFFSTGGDPTSSHSPTHGPELEAGLSRGWHVVVPDYELFTSNFGAEFEAGRAVLDGLAAAKSFLGYKDAVMGAYGYSGGGTPTAFATAQESTYGKSLNLNMKGYAFGGTTANMTSQIIKWNGSKNSGGVFKIIYGLAQVNNDWQERLKSISTSNMTDSITAQASTCDKAPKTKNGLKTTNVDILTKDYTSKGSKLLNDDVFKPILEKLVLGVDSDLTPKTPSLMYHSTHDEIAPFQDAEDAAKRWCKNSAPLFWKPLSDTGKHAATENAFIDTALTWLDDRLSGKSTTGDIKSCDFS